uniref:Uncharacterized protein n=1 Tax=Heterorhabditis bacteriophora TaxID=37862 RepID=A0A1I7X7J1_HETBA
MSGELRGDCLEPRNHEALLCGRKSLVDHSNQLTPADVVRTPTIEHSSEKNI